MQTIPRTVLYDTKTGTNVLQWPVKEIESLRLSSSEFTELVVKPGSVVPLDIGTATQVLTTINFVQLYYTIRL